MVSGPKLANTAKNISEKGEIYEMNITFLIGNGFDLNLGLDTRYSDFLKDYLQDNPKDNEEIKSFKTDIRKQQSENSTPAENLWVNAELAFGHYTDDIVKQGKKADSFSRRRIDFGRKLATYLQKQEKRVCVEENEQAFVDGIRHFRSGLTEVQNDAVKRSYDLFDGGCTFNFLVFNYTCIIDRFIEAVRKRKIQLGTRVYRNSTYDNSFGKTIHVHGTTRKDMVFGVNDESQIENMTLFEDNSPFYLNSFIKQKTNKGNEAQTDEKAHEVIKTSSFIYIYGMSIGATDKIWWQRIVERMKVQPHAHVFIYCHDVPQDTLIKEGRWFYEEAKKNQLLAFADGDNSALKSRIHIVDNNIFEAFTNIATAPEANEVIEKVTEFASLIS